MYPYAAFKIDGTHCDLLHNPGQVPTYFRPRVPYVLTVHDLIPLLYPQTTRLARPTIYRMLYGRTLRSATRVIASSENTKRDIQRLFSVDESRIAVVPLGINDRFAAAEAHETEAGARAEIERDRAIRARLDISSPYVLYVGTLEGRKGLGTLVDAFRILIDRGLPHQLVLAGASGWKTRGLERALARVGDQAHSHHRLRC